MQKLRHTSKRLNLRLLCSALLLALFVCCSSMALAASQVDISQPEPTINVPLSSWNELKKNSIEASSLIKSSSLSLSEAQSLTAKQGIELKELRIINEEQGKELNELRNINEKQSKELERASAVITEQESSLTETSNSLDELKNEIKNNRRTEQRLRRQRDTWAAGGVVGFLVGAAGAIR